MQPLHYSSEIEQYHGVFYGPRIGFCLFCLRGRKSDANPVEFCRIVGHSGHGCPVSSQATGLQSPAESAFLAACAAQKRSGMGKTAVFVPCLLAADRLFGEGSAFGISPNRGAPNRASSGC